MATQFVMNTKKGDFRVLVHQPGLNDNKDYIMISAEDAEAVMSGKKTGAQVVKELFLKTRMEEVGIAKDAVIDGSKLAAPAPEAPATAAAPVAAPAPAPAADAPATANAAPAAEAPAPAPQVDILKMTAAELREYGKKFGFAFQYETKKDMIALIVQKESAAPAPAPAADAPATAETPVTE